MTEIMLDAGARLEQPFHGRVEPTPRSRKAFRIERDTSSALMGLSVVFAGTVWVLVTMFTAPPPASERERLAAREAARMETAAYVATGK